MERLFTGLTHAVEGTPAIALGAALVWGVLSIVLSPCHLSSIPLIVGFISGQGRTTTRRAFTVATLFAIGILVTIAAVGAITAAAGRMMGDVGQWGNYLVAGIFFVVGLYLLDVVPLPWSGPGQVNMKGRGMLAAFLLGLLFGIAVGPCTFVYMAPMLGVTFKLAGTQALYSALLLLAYGVGHCAVIVMAGTFTEMVQRYLDWNEQSRGIKILKGRMWRAGAGRRGLPDLHGAVTHDRVMACPCSRQRLECVRLAGAFVWRRARKGVFALHLTLRVLPQYESGSKLHALQTLREFQRPRP